MPRPVIALLTDFGVRDHYVAAMKGVMLDIARDAALVDITHEIPPQDVLSAAIELAACWRFFPAGSIFLVVVDPGVGTSRRAVAAAAADRFFVAPDNGVLGLVFDDAPPSSVVEITERKYQRFEISRTFEGRDRFAPAAAWLACGTTLQALGPLVSDPVSLDVPRARPGPGVIAGENIKIDRFGNAISNVRGSMLPNLLDQGGGGLVRAAGQHRLPLVRTYGDVPPRQCCALVGSSGYVEIAVNGGSAARELGLERGTRVVVAKDQASLDAAS